MDESGTESIGHRLERAWKLRDHDPVKALGILDELPPDGFGQGERANAAVVRAAVENRSGKQADALRRCLHADTALDAVPVDRWRARLTLLLATMHFDAGHASTALDSAYQALDQAATAGDSEVTFSSHCLIARLLGALDDVEGSERSLAAAEHHAAGNEEHLATLAWVTAALLTDRGRAADAFAIVAEPDQVLGTTTVPRARLRLYAARARAASELGLVDEARASLAEARSLAGVLGRPSPELDIPEARLLFAEGKLDEARLLLTAAEDAFSALDRRPPRGMSELRAEIAAAADDFVSAYEETERARQADTAFRTRHVAQVAQLRMDRHAADASRRVDKLKQTNDELAATNRELRELHDHVVELSARDPLTGLFNRRQLFLEAGLLLRLATRYSRPFSVAMVDIDRFKAVNDRFFHTTGDTVLAELAGLLSAGVRDSDLVGRYGGDEFVILLPEVGVEGAEVLCERIRATVESHRWSDIAEGLDVTVTIGIASALARESAEDLLHRADQRLYAAKTSGRNRIAS